MPDQSSFNLFKTYVHLEDGPGSLPIEVADDFWVKLSTRADLQEGWLVTASHVTEKWDRWEMHPAGDEVVLLLRGAMDLVLDENEGERVVQLKPGSACIVPKGVWHRAVVNEPSNTLRMTRGVGTERCPVSQ